MGILKSLKKMVEMTDFFNSTQMLRYENQNQYRTFTGGVLSLAIITTIVIGFASMIIDTLTLSSISYTQNVMTHTDPPLTTITASPDNNFMFGIEIWHQNFSSPVRYFDVYVTLFTGGSGNQIPIQLNLVQCTKEHWASMPEVVDKFDLLRMSGWLCPPLGAQYDIVGKLTSDFYQQLIIGIGTCNNGTDPNRQCATPEQIQQNFDDNRGAFYFTFYYINTIMNPDQPEYKTYYLQDNAYVTFGQLIGSESFLYFSDFNIESDYSIWPFSSIEKDKGFMTQNLPVSHPYSITTENNALYVVFGIAKSPNSIFINREVQKISQVFSFIGGLIGAIMAGLFVINQYTSFAYELSIALSIFRHETHPQEQEKQKSRPIVNLVQFFQYHWFALKKWLNEDYKDDHLEHVYECRREILRQLDIKSLIKRLVFLQYSMTFVFTDYQLEGLQLRKPCSPQQVKKLRKKIENVDLLDMQSDFSSKSETNDKPMNDQIQPKPQSSPLEFLKSAKVANLDASTRPLYMLRPPEAIKNGQQMVDIESISGISVLPDKQKSDKQKCLKTKQEKKRTMRMKDLMESAKEGNQISLRIWETIRTINEDPHS